MAGVAPSLAARQARSLPNGIGEMQMIIADQARPPGGRSPIAGRCLYHANGRMPVDADDPFALTSFDQYFVAMHRGEERQALHPIDVNPQSVIVAQIVELGGIFALDRGDPHGFAFPVGVSLFADR